MSHIYTILILFKNYNFGSNLKIGQIRPFGLMTTMVRELMIKKCGLWGLKSDLYTHKKMRPIGLIAVDLKVFG